MLLQVRAHICAGIAENMMTEGLGSDTTLPVLTVTVAFGGIGTSHVVHSEQATTVT
jgi:hypothetical protein